MGQKPNLFNFWDNSNLFSSELKPKGRDCTIPLRRGECVFRSGDIWTQTTKRRLMRPFPVGSRDWETWRLMEDETPDNNGSYVTFILKRNVETRHKKISWSTDQNQGGLRMVSSPTGVKTLQRWGKTRGTDLGLLFILGFLFVF